MGGLVDRSAAFEARLKEIGLLQASQDALFGAGNDTISKFAFCNEPPGQPVDEQSFSDFMTTNLGAAPSVGQLTIARRMLFEAHTLMIHSVKEKVEKHPVKLLLQKCQQPNVTAKQSMQSTIS